MLFLTFLAGLAVNFASYVPFGNVNLTVVQLTINRGIRNALYFIVSFSIIEFFFTYAIMYFADWFAQQKALVYWLDWVLIAVFLIMSITSWRNTQKEKYVNYSHKDSIKYGIILGFVNPTQIPFWMICGTYLISHHWITTTAKGSLAIFSIGSAIGSFLCLFCFAKFSKYLHEKFTLSGKVINRSIAVIFLVLAILKFIHLVL
jgi:threonine/homoserine/homoserine lactone efflux protein